MDDSGIRIINLIENVIENKEGLSDLYLATGAPPFMRCKEKIYPIDSTHIMTDTDIINILEWLENGCTLSPPHGRQPIHDYKYFANAIPMDFGATYKSKRLRCNLDRTWKGLDLTIRILPNEIKTLKSLGLPESLYNLMNMKHGLILICGPTGSGKSTTLAALIDYVNTHDCKKIVMLEDPIEYIIPRKQSLIHQREIPNNSSFLPYLKSALRQKPDIIVVGEIRDQDTAVMTIQAAETGHLVLSTLHTTSTQQTLMRLSDMLPEDIRSNILNVLSNTLKAIIVQRLIRNEDKGSVRCAYEICLVDFAISLLIRTAKHHQIPNQLILSKGCVSLNDSLLSLVSKGYITEQEALRHSYDPENLRF